MTQRTIHDTTCQRGYTAKVRPSRKVTDATKRRLAEGLPDSPQDYELDHLIPLGLGGHPTSPENLWLQSWPEAAIKDRDELRLPRELCAGQLAARYRLPAMYEWHEIVEDGGFMSYGPNRVELSRRVAVYVDRILKGAKPADFPVERATKFELAVNVKTAAALGLTIPPSLLGLTG